MSFFNDDLPPFAGIDIGWDGDPTFPIGEYVVIPDTGNVATDFVHFRIAVFNESGTWKGYVGNGYFAATYYDQFYGGGDNSQENWAQRTVTHQGADITLDVSTPPFDSGIDALVTGGSGQTLVDNKTYYVYLRVEVHYEQIDQWNTFRSDEEGATVIVETVVGVTTLFMQAADRTTGDAESLTFGTYGTSDPSTDANGYRYLLIGTIIVPSGDTGAVVGQIIKDAIYIESTVRGHRLDNGGLGINSVGDIGNTGVLSIIQGTGITVDTGTGDVTVANDGVISLTDSDNIQVVNSGSGVWDVGEVTP